MKLKKGSDFIGKSALAAVPGSGIRKERVGLELAGKRIARDGATVLIGDRQVGKVTSGTFSPTLEKSIAMAYVEPESANVGQGVDIDIRGKRESATVVELPFYRRSK